MSTVGWPCVPSGRTRREEAAARARGGGDRWELLVFYDRPRCARPNDDDASGREGALSSRERSSDAEDEREGETLRETTEEVSSRARRRRAAADAGARG